MTTFYPFLNRDKGDAYIKALLKAGYSIQNNYDADILLIDYERPTIRTDVEKFLEHGPVFIYPHSAFSEIIWDGLYEPLMVSCNFVPGSGQQKVMASYGYPCPVQAVGWSYSEVEEFAPTTGSKLLFAPKHPNLQRRSICEQDIAANQIAMQLILENFNLFDKITIRYVGSLKESGLEFYGHTFATYEQSTFLMADAVTSIEKADIVIACDTLAYLSVAAGKPTIFFGQDIVPHNIRRVVASYNKYKKIRDFPLDIRSCKGYYEFRDLIETAAGGSKKVESWAKRFIGEPFDQHKFIETVDKYKET